ncbi:bacterial surface protein [Paenibacillus lignilyticus]|uniref:Bacterial surface protein n=1 Tax=Paenibacillus lignilyticus TaxID=1172615 RepID=A0ABS5CM65_9BACL|nr:bacterial surface protein [Paenibacillus lignilyticus]MBP3966926.1 bacterial surface protein [Paenibacillus lignilyticus]
MRTNKHAAPLWQRTWLTMMLAIVLSFSSFAGLAYADEVVTGLAFENAPSPAVLYIDDDSISLEVNATIQGATSVKSVTTDATWSSSNTAILKVSAGVVTGLAKGTATVSATYKGYKVTLPITVNYRYDNVTIAEGGTNVGATEEVHLGDTISYTLTAIKSGSTNEDVTDSATWTSSNPNVATVDDGDIKLLNAGETTITAKYKGRSDTVRLIATSPYDKLTISPDDLLEFYVGDGNKSLTAVVTTEDDDSATVTDTAQWTSGNTAVATVSKGIVTPVGSGSTTITATHLGVSNSINVVVRPAYEAMRLNPKEDQHLSMQDSPVTFNVTVMKGTGIPEVVTSKATWTSSNFFVATVKDGVVTPKGIGTTVIKATYLGLSQQVSVTVYPTVSSLKAASETVDAFLNDSVTLPKVSAESIAEETIDVTNLVAWTSSDKDIVDKVDGKWTAKKVGTAVLTGTIQSKSVTVTVVVHEKPLMLTTDQTNASVVLGKEVKLPVITLMYENGEEEDVTSLVTWKSSSANLLVKAPNMRGLQASSVTLTASYLGKSTTIRVTIEEEITKLFVDASSLSLNISRTKNLKVTGIYKSGKSVSLSSKMNWTMNPETLASIKGSTVKALTEGTGKLTGTYQGKSIEVAITVVAKVKKLTSSAKSLTLAAEGKETVKVTAEYDVGRITDVTKSAVWTVGNNKVATVEAGVITAVGKGSTMVRATFDGKSISIRVIVK